MANHDISKLVGTSFTITSGLIYVDELANAIRKLDPVNGDRLVGIVMHDNGIDFVAERLYEVRLGMSKGIDFSNCQSYEEINTMIFMNNLKEV